MAPSATVGAPRSGPAGFTFQNPNPPAASSASQPLTGIGFQPKAVWFFSSGGATPTATFPCNFFTGVDDAVTHVGRATCSGWFLSCNNSEAAWSTSYSLVANRAIAINQITLAGYVSSFDPDGLTIQWDFLTFGARPIVDWIGVAFGGDAACQFTVGIRNTPPLGSDAITGLGFAPTGLISWLNDGVPAGFPIRTAGALGAIGFASSTACGGAFAFSHSSGCAAGNVSEMYSQQEAKLWVDPVHGASGTLVSMDADGFTMNNSAAQPGGYFVYLAMGGFAVNTGVFTTAAAGAVPVPILAGLPRALLLFGGNKPAAVGITDDYLYTAGAGTANEQMSAWSGNLDAEPAFGKAHFSFDTTRILHARDPTGFATSTLASQTSLVGFASQAVNLTATLSDGLTREWFYMILADDLGLGACGAGAPPLFSDCFTSDEIIGLPGSDGCVSAAVFDPVSSSASLGTIDTEADEVLLTEDDEPLLLEDDPFAVGAGCRVGFPVS